MPYAEALHLTAKLSPPGSWREFIQRFRTEADCEAFLFQVRYPQGFCCPRCAATRGWRLEDRRVLECANGHKVSLTAGTVLHGTRQPLLTWFQAVDLITMSASGINRPNRSRHKSATAGPTARSRSRHKPAGA
jgi:hypothetical protein